MADRPKVSEREARLQRIAAALRKNLSRRKAQARGRAEHEAEPHDSAGIIPDKDKG